MLLKLSSAVSSAAGSPLAVLIGALVGASVLAFAAGVFGRDKARGRGKAAYAASGALGAAALLGAFRLGLVPVIVPGAAEAAVGVFAASLLAFTSAVMRPQKSHPFISVLIFSSVLSLVGIAAINLALAGQISPLLSLLSMGAIVSTLILAIANNSRGWIVTGLSVFGIGLMISAPFIGPLFGSAIDIGLAAFLAGTLSAVGLTLPFSGGASGRGQSLEASSMAAGQGTSAMLSSHAKPKSRVRAHVGLAETQLSEVLDFVGVAVLDWGPQTSSQSASFCTLIGAETCSELTPEALRDFIAADDQAAFDQDVIGVDAGDGDYDTVLRLTNGTRARFRGARAVSPEGELERIINFLELVPDSSTMSATTQREAVYEPISSAADVPEDQQPEGDTTAATHSDDIETRAEASKVDKPARVEKIKAPKKLFKLASWSKKRTGDDANEAMSTGADNPQPAKTELATTATDSAVSTTSLSRKRTMLFLGGRGAGRPLKNAKNQKEAQVTNPAAMQNQTPNVSQSSALSARIDANLEPVAEIGRRRKKFGIQVFQ